MENDLQNKVIEKFWETFNIWKNDAPEYYSEIFHNILPDDLNIIISEIDLKSSEWPKCDCTNIIIKILICHAGNELGKYELWFSMSGIDNDDDFGWSIKPLSFFQQINAPKDNKIAEQLKKYVKENKLHDKAIDCFWIAFNNWKKDCPKKFVESFDGVPLDNLNVFVHSIGLRSAQWPECDFNHVHIGILIHYGDRQLGNYRCFFSLGDDVDDDDILEIY